MGTMTEHFVAIPMASDFIGNFRQVDEHIFAGAQPQIPEGIRELRDVYGIKSVVDLQQENALEVQESLACTDLGVDLYSIPLPGVELFHELPDKQVTMALAVLNNPDAWPVFVHCAHGADRTGAIIGIHRIDSGWTLKEALTEMHRYHNAFLEWGMRDTVEDYLERRAKGK